MKYLIISDIHGSYYYAKKIVEIEKRENFLQKMVVLVYYIVNSNCYRIYNNYGNSTYDGDGRNT